jgi:hypothetical protein
MSSVEQNRPRQLRYQVPWRSNKHALFTSHTRCALLIENYLRQGQYGNESNKGYRKQGHYSLRRICKIMTLKVIRKKWDYFSFSVGNFQYAIITCMHMMLTAVFLWIETVAKIINDFTDDDFFNCQIAARLLTLDLFCIITYQCDSYTSIKLEVWVGF